jgi:hypothetical protein
VNRDPLLPPAANAGPAFWAQKTKSGNGRGKSGVGKNDIVGDLVKLNDSINDVIFIIGRKMISFSPPSWPTTGLVSDGLTGGRSARKFFRKP